MKSLFALVLLTVSLICVPCQSWGKIHDVKNSLELQSALNEAGKNGENDLIRVQEGLYPGNFAYVEHRTEEARYTWIEGGYSPEGNRVYDPSKTILDGYRKGCVLDCLVRGSLIVSNLTIQRGESDNRPGGLFVTHHPMNEPGYILIFNNIITRNRTTLKGGGMAAESFAPDGVAGNIVLVGNKIVGNSDTGNIGGGGAWLRVISRTLENNTGQIRVVGNTIWRNASEGSGGGVHVWTRSDWEGAGGVTFSDNFILNNTAGTSYHDAPGGGGIYILSESRSELNTGPSQPVAILHNTLRGNSTGAKGGGASIVTKSVTCPAADIEINNNSFIRNSTGSGGGAYVRSRSIDGRSGTVSLNGNMLRHNSAKGQAGGVWAASSSVNGTTGEVILTNNIIVENTADYHYGGLGASGDLTLTNNTIADNESAFKAGGAGLAAHVFANAYNNIIRGNSAPEDMGGDLWLVGSGLYAGFNNDYSDMLGAWSNEGGNIDQDPLFVGGGDYHLTIASPCRDAGTPTAVHLPDTDYDGEIRIYGNAPDMGADETRLHFTPVDLSLALPNTLDRLLEDSSVKPMQ